MTDLVKRLRDGGFLMVDDKSSIKEYYFESEGLKAESADCIEKLEAALGKIMDTDPDEGTSWFHDIARKALEGKDDV
jgi:hypothetical protein